MTLRLGLFLFVVLLSTGTSAQTLNKTIANQYISLNADAIKADYDVFSEMVTFSFSSSIRTTGEALTDILQHVGYRLAEPAVSDPYISHLLESPLPVLHRNIGPASIVDVLDILTGYGWVVVRDPVHRLVSFDIRENFRPCDYVEASDTCR